MMLELSVLMPSLLHASPVYTYPALARPGEIGVHVIHRIITESSLYWSTL